MYYCVSDIHGMYELFKKGCRDLLKAGDELYILGDEIDRGPEPLKVLNSVLSRNNDLFSFPIENETTKPKFTILSGNHEYMMVEYIDQVYRYAKKFKGVKIDSIEGFWFYSKQLESKSNWLNNNGGDVTLKQLKEQINSIDELELLYSKVKNLPHMKKLDMNGTKICLVHGSPNRNRRHSLWDRMSITKDYSKYGDLIVYGHTPTFMYETEKVDKMRVLYLGNTIGIDTGAVFQGEFGGRLSFLCLDNLRAYYYE